MKVTAIFGPPGTGKTRTLVEMAAGQKALMLSYTKAAALETASRVPDGGEIKASTMHSMVFNLLGMNRAQVVDGKKLKEFGKATGIPFKGMDDNTDTLQEGDEYISVLAFSNNRMMKLMDAYDHFGRPGTMHKFEMFVKEYRGWKDTYGYVDFDDMLHNFLNSRISVPEYKHIYLDEAQDCSPLQWRAFHRLCNPKAEIVIAGDDDQAIYEWNGADPHGMMDFLQSNEGEMRILSQSHRIPRIVHDFVHEAVLQRIKRRVEKVFNPRDEEGVFESWGDISNISFDGLSRDGGGMVLVRDRWRLEEAKRMMNREMVPYDVLGGHSPWTSAIANKIRNGENVEWDSKTVHWREFYRQADLSRPVNITLSTIHQAKGREADTVVLDLTLPARTLEAMYNDPDAELRVMYVALTRARHNLVVCGENPLI